MSSASRKKSEQWRAYAASARAIANELLQYLAAQAAYSPDRGGIDFAQVHFGRIDAKALGQFAEWGSEHGFPWHDTPGYIKSDARHLDLSLWYGDTLCGLCFATPSGARTLVRIRLLEGKPLQPDGHHKLKKRVIELCVLAVTQYCKIIGAKVIQIDDPLDGAIHVYEQNNFTMNNGVLEMLVAS